MGEGGGGQGQVGKRPYFDHFFFETFLQITRTKVKLPHFGLYGGKACKFNGSEFTRDKNETDTKGKIYAGSETVEEYNICELAICPLELRGKPIDPGETCQFKGSWAGGLLLIF